MQSPADRVPSEGVKTQTHVNHISRCLVVGSILLSWHLAGGRACSTEGVRDLLYGRKCCTHGNVRMLPVPDDVSKRITSYTHEWGLARKDGASEAQQQCTCGICIAQGSPSSSCVLLNGRLVVRRQDEICRTLCLGRWPVQMICRFVKFLLASLAKHADTPDWGL